jgi:TetR/AcrR family transcriptional repressor of mexJK operon
VTDQSSVRKRAKRDQIRRGATQVFLAEGFAGATTDAIARQAGVSKQTLYVYYRAKEELMVDVLAAHVRELRDESDWKMDDHLVDSLPAFRTALTELAGGVVRALLNPDYLALVRVIIADTPRVPEIGRLWAEMISGRIRRIVADLLGRAAAAGVARIPDVDAATRLLVGGLLTYVLPDGILSTDHPVTPPEPERIGAIIDLFLRALT